MQAALEKMQAAFSKMQAALAKMQAAFSKKQAAFSKKQAAFSGPVYSHEKTLIIPCRCKGFLSAFEKKSPVQFVTISQHI